MDALLEFVNQVLPPENDGFRCWVAIKKGKPVRQGFCDTNDQLATLLAGIDSRQWDAYFACATYKEPVSRTQENVKSVKSFWLDIDAGPRKPYPDAEAAISAVNSFATIVGLPLPLIVCSGNGVHCYWVLENPIRPDEWTAHAKALKALTKQHNLHADPARTADCASILRPVQTLNWKKPEAPLEVYCVQDAPASPCNLLVAKINPVGIPPVQDLGKDILGGLDKAVPQTPSSALLASKHCGQLKHFADTRGNVIEPVWYACLGVLAHCTDGETLAQEWSSGHPDYSQEQTAKKFEQARTRSGPTTCAKFKDINPDGCKGCPHAITSPIQLGKSEATITPPLIPDMEEKKPWLPDGFRWGPNMQIQTQIKDPDPVEGEKPKPIWITVCEHPFYIDSIREDETNGVSGAKTVMIYHRTAHNPWKHFAIGRSTLEGMGWKSALAGMGVSCSFNMDKYFKKLLVMWIDGKMKMSKDEICYKSYGWRDDNKSFVLGRKLYTKDKVIAVSGTKQVENYSDKLCPNPKGNFEDWRKLVSKLFSPGCEAQGFALLTSFSSVLMKLVSGPSEGGCILSLCTYGSGRGKSTAIAAAETVWGRQGCLRLVDDASNVSKFKSLGVANNCPVVVDEWGHGYAEEIAPFIKQFTGGNEKQRMNQGAELVLEKLDWKLNFIGTTNEPVSDKLKVGNYYAQAMRILEMSVSLPPSLARTVTTDMETELEKHSGFAGPIFIMHLLKHYDMELLRQEINQVAVKLSQMLGIDNSDARYNLRLTAANVVVAKMLTRSISPSEPAMLDFYYKPTIEYAINAIKENILSDTSGKMDTTDILAHFIRENMHNFIVIDHAYVGGKDYNEVYNTPKQKLMGRYEKREGFLYVPHTLIRAHCAKMKIPYLEFGRDLLARGVIRNRNRKTTLTSGIPEATPAVESCWHIDLGHEDMGHVATIVSMETAKKVGEAFQDPKKKKTLL